MSLKGPWKKVPGNTETLHRRRDRTAAGRRLPLLQLAKHMKPDDTKLHEILRDARPTPPVPAHFHANVWQRIEVAGVAAESHSWLDAMAALVLRPRIAYTTLAALMLAGILLGAREGMLTAKMHAQERYLALVAPNPLR